MSDVAKVPQHGEKRRRLRLAWWIWPVVALIVITGGVGAYAGAGGFSYSRSVPPTTPAAHPLISDSGGSSGQTSGGSQSQSPHVAAGGALLGLPPSPVITSEPANPTMSTTAAFAYRDDVLLTSFRCSLDGSAYSQCGAVINLPSTGAITYTSLLPGSHCFSVEGVTALLLVSNPTTYCWQQNGVGFTMSWANPGKFYPGTSQSADLTIANPNGKAITLGVGAINIAITTSNPSACPSSNFGMTQSNTASATISANTTETLSAAGLSPSELPVITMFDGSGGAGSHDDQDGCKGVTLMFVFSGTASGS